MNETPDPHESPALRWVMAQLALAFPNMSIPWEPASYILSEIRVIQGTGDLKVSVIRNAKLERRILRLVRSPKRVGIEGELKRLVAATRRAIDDPRANEQFAQTWAETSDAARTVLRWDARVAVENTRAGFVHDVSRGRYQLLPWPVDALPLIEAALRDLAVAPGHERRKRKPDALDEALSAAIARAFMMLSDCSESRASDRTAMICISTFARSMDEKFGLGIYKKGSRQLRNLQRKYSAKLL